MEPLTQFLSGRFEAKPLHLRLFLDVGRCWLEWSFFIRFGNRVGQQKRSGIAIEEAPHLRVYCAGRLQAVAFLISLDRNPEIVAVDAINFARREPGTVQKNLR